MVLGEGKPTVRHETYAIAEAEAMRLARVHPGQEFIVLAAMAVAKKTDVVVDRIGQLDDWLPF